MKIVSQALSSPSVSDVTNTVADNNFVEGQKGILASMDLDWDVIKAPLGVGPVAFFMKSQSVHNIASSQAIETKKSGKIRRDPGYLRSGLIWI